MSTFFVERGIAIMVKSYSVDLKNLAIRKYMMTQSCRKVAKVLEVGKTTVNNWIKQHPMTRRPPWKKMTEEAQACISECINQNPFITMASIKQCIQIRMGLCLSEECVRLSRVSSNFTRKKVNRVVTKEGLHAHRLQFEQDRLQYSTNDVISIDESSFWFSMKPGYGYAKKGKRLEVNDHYKKNVRWTLLLAVSNDRVLTWKLYNTSCTSATFADFINTMDTRGRTTLLMDNAAIHKAKIVEDACHTRCLRPWFLPPYSPEYQPVEHVFSVVKNGYRRQPTPKDVSLELVTGRLEYGLNKLNQDTLKNTFSHCWAYSYPKIEV